MNEQKKYYLINQKIEIQYMFKPLNNVLVTVLINYCDTGWKTYDSAMIAGNYRIDMARTFWNSLIKQGFVKHAI
tara:strand:- start:854 stop:1075 length:222 start_codon:yes stop_codon:yes gene_type:complete